MSSKYYILSVEWAKQWWKYVGDDSLSPRPEMINNSELICEHGKVKYDIIATCIDDDEDRKNLKYLVLEDHTWRSLLNSYQTPPDHEISLCVSRVNYSSNSYPRYPVSLEAELTPEACTQCVEEFNRKELEEARNFKQKKLKIVEDKKEYFYRLKDTEIDCSSTTTVGELKLLIFQYMDIAPNKQKLIYDKRHLDDDMQPLSFFGVTPLKPIELHKGISTDTTSNNVVPQEKEVGFAGTFLTNSSEALKQSETSPLTPEKSVTKPTTPPQSPKVDEVHEWPQCRFCTFINSNTSRICEVCQNQN